MAVAESLVASVVADISARMKDPRFTQIAVGHFVESQPQLAQYMSVKAARIGGAQGVLELAFHAGFLCECLKKHTGRDLPTVDFKLLDFASQGDPVARFTAREPALASYVGSNLDQENQRVELCRIGLALVMAADRKGP